MKLIRAILLIAGATLATACARPQPDENGFSLADVTVVTFRPGTDTAERVLSHTYGTARRDTVTIAIVPAVERRR